MKYSSHEGLVTTHRSTYVTRTCAVEEWEVHCPLITVDVRIEVPCATQRTLRIVVKQSKCLVAVVAQNTPCDAGLVIVIEPELLGTAAHCALTVLHKHHARVRADRNTCANILVAPAAHGTCAVVEVLAGQHVATRATDLVCVTVRYVEKLRTVPHGVNTAQVRVDRLTHTDRSFHHVANVLPT